MIDKEHSTQQGNDPLVGRVLGGRFAIQQLVAKGGMGRVYRAEQRPLGRTVAVKVLHLDGRNEDDGGFRERFFREASICARLTHPNTVRVFDYGSEDGVYFIVMEFLEGRTLNDLVRREGPLDVHRAISLVRQVCRSLAQAHSQGVVHRDLKPANVFVSRHGEDEFVKVLDFGLVKSMDAQSQVTRAGNILGSPAYMSPEQVLGTPVGPAADIYSLGVILYACLTRTLPFKREHPMAVLNAHAHAPPPPFSTAAPGTQVPGHIEWVVMRCLEKKAQDRFTSMNELDRALRLCQLELQGTLPDFECKLQGGRLVLPEGMEDGASLSQSRIRTEPNAVTDQPSSPTLNIQQSEPSGTGLTGGHTAEPTWAETGVTEPEPQGRPLRDFVIAAVIVMLLSVIGAVGLGAIGWFFLLPQPEAPVEAAVEAAVEEPAELPEPVQPEPEALVEEPEPEPEPAEPEVVEEPVVRKPKSTSSRPKTRRKAPDPLPIEEPTPEQDTTEIAPLGEDDMPSFGILVEPQDPEPTQPPEDEGGSIGKTSDLKDPWDE